MRTFKKHLLEARKNRLSELLKGYKHHPIILQIGLDSTVITIHDKKAMNELMIFLKDSGVKIKPNFMDEDEHSFHTDGYGKISFNFDTNIRRLANKRLKKITLRLTFGVKNAIMPSEVSEHIVWPMVNKFRQTPDNRHTFYHEDWWGIGDHSYFVSIYQFENRKLADKVKKAIKKELFHLKPHIQEL